MKTNGTRLLVIVIFLYLFVLVVSFSASAQPDYDFSSQSLIAGSDKTVGAQYRFTNVKPGVDAIVTITSLTAGLTLNDIDGASGFKEAFQPIIQVPAGANGYAEFKIDFVDAGTFTPQLMKEVPLTCIDVDGRRPGGLPIYEFDMVQQTPGLYVDYDMLGGELNISFSPSWVSGFNTGGIDYPGVDTVAKQVMFTTVSSSVYSMTVRVGADNQTAASQQRLRSIYFKRFTYANAFLAKSPLLSFTGLEKNKKVALNWQLEKNNQLQAVIIEKKKGSSFEAIGHVLLYESSVQSDMFHFTDAESLQALSQYRLKMIATNGAIAYSNILSFRNTENGQQPFKVYPSAIHSSASVTVSAFRKGQAIFEVVDYSGRLIHSQSFQVQEGNNTLQLNSLGSLMSGNYIAVVKIDNKVYNQKIFKQ